MKEMASLGFGSRALLVISFLAILVAVCVKTTNGAVYKVGESAGWTTIGNVDYKNWTASKTFQVGDVIVFEYNPQYHNVLQVTHADFRACNVSSPIATLSTGNDSITITSPKHYFFICGVTGHCQAGQKVDINARQTASIGRSPASAPTADDAAPVPAPAAANAAPLIDLNRLFVKVIMALALAFVGVFA